MLTAGEIAGESGPAGDRRRLVPVECTVLLCKVLRIESCLKRRPYAAGDGLSWPLQ
jgi:hypothetical protein